MATAVGAVWALVRAAPTPSGAEVGMLEQSLARTVKSVWDMSDENFMKHMERSHPEDLKLEFKVEPGRTERILREGGAWREYHDTIHRMYPFGRDDKHEHLER